MSREMCRLFATNFVEQTAVREERENFDADARGKFNFDE